MDANIRCKECGSKEIWLHFDDYEWVVSEPMTQEMIQHIMNAKVERWDATWQCQCIEDETDGVVEYADGSIDDEMDSATRFIINFQNGKVKP